MGFGLWWEYSENGARASRPGPVPAQIMPGRARGSDIAGLSPINSKPTIVMYLCPNPADFIFSLWNRVHSRVLIEILMTRFASPHMRWLVAVLMTVALPMCYCNGHVFSRAIAGGTSETTPAQHASHDGSSWGMQSTDAHHHDDQGCCPSDSDTDSSPCNSNSPCGCGQSTRHLTLPDTDNTSVVSTRQLAAISSSLAEDIHKPLWSRTEGIFYRGVLCLQSSLLGQHCAHIV